MPGTFGQKPSDSHVVWTNRPEAGEGKKRFDFEYLELWAAHFGVDYEIRTRVDHERADEPREQHAVVFEWAEMDGDTLSLGDKEVTMGTKETPRTFVEIDEAGVARVKSWTRETVVDLRELWLDGPKLTFVAAGQESKSLDARKLLSENRPSEV